MQVERKSRVLFKWRPGAYNARTTVLVRNNNLIYTETYINVKMSNISKDFIALTHSLAANQVVGRVMAYQANNS